MSDEAKLIAVLHRRKLRTHALHLWFGENNEASTNESSCPSERDPAKWWSGVAADLSAVLEGKAKPWQAVRSLWEQQRASEGQHSNPPLFAAAADGQQKPAFVVPPKSGIVQPEKRWSVRECREWLDICGVRHDDVLEREDLYRRVEATLAEACRYSSGADNAHRGTHYRPPQPEPIPKQPDTRYFRSRVNARKFQESNRRRKQTWYSSRADASTPWDYCGCSYTGFVHHTTGTEDDAGYCHANGSSAGQYTMPPGGAAPPTSPAETKSKSSSSETRAASGSPESKPNRKRKRKYNASGRTRRRQSTGGRGEENKLDSTWARNVLGIRDTDDARAIKKKYHMLAREWHPDKVAAASNTDDGAGVAAATAKFQQIAAAYELLQSSNS